MKKSHGSRPAGSAQNAVTKSKRRGKAILTVSGPVSLSPTFRVETVAIMSGVDDNVVTYRAGPKSFFVGGFQVSETQFRRVGLPMKLCYLCHKREATIPERNRPGRLIKRICRHCNADRVFEDLKRRLAWGKFSDKNPSC